MCGTRYVLMLININMQCYLLICLIRLNFHIVNLILTFKYDQCIVLILSLKILVDVTIAYIPVKFTCQPLRIITIKAYNIVLYVTLMS